MKIKVGIFGFGYWGKNVARNFFQSPLFDLVSIVDPDPVRQKEAQAQYPTVKVSGLASDILDDSEISAIAVITPVNTHYELATKSLESGKHVLIEKPITANYDLAKKLVKLAEDKDLTLIVDHTFLYTGAVQKIRELIDRGELGQIDYIDSLRINLGLFRNDTTVLWDLASHDISIFNFIFDEKPNALQAIGVSHTSNGLENIVYVTLHYPSGAIAHCNCSWSSPVKIRQMLVGGKKKMIVYNDIEPTSKVMVYDRGYEIRSTEEKNKFLVDYRMGDAFAPKLSIREAIAEMVEDFGTSIISKSKPLSNGEAAIDVIKILEAAERSIREDGCLLALNLEEPA